MHSILYLRILSLFLYCFLGRDRQIHQFVFPLTDAFIGCFVYVCALTRAWTCNPGISGCSNPGVPNLFGIKDRFFPWGRSGSVRRRSSGELVLLTWWLPLTSCCCRGLGRNMRWSSGKLPARARIFITMQFKSQGFENKEMAIRGPLRKEWVLSLIASKDGV